MNTWLIKLRQSSMCGTENVQVGRGSRWTMQKIGATYVLASPYEIQGAQDKKRSSNF
ncbi:hypothetical protein [Peribacillus simplex]|uniref:hypothetical protein n=1 Tax=Peribacillus simplex TaxID=1478 RepID=UPI003D2B98BF